MYTEYLLHTIHVRKMSVHFREFEELALSLIYFNEHRCACINRIYKPHRRILVYCIKSSLHLLI